MSRVADDARLHPWLHWQVVVVLNAIAAVNLKKGFWNTGGGDEPPCS
jgi:hypothetical protein